MGIRIDKKISGYSVVKPEDKAQQTYTAVTDEASLVEPIGMAMAGVTPSNEGNFAA